MAQCDHNWRSALLFIWTRFQGSKDPPDLKEYGSFSTSALICSPHLPSLGLCYSPVPFPNHPSLLGHDSMVSITGSHGWWGLQFTWSLLLCMCYFLWSQIRWTPVTQAFWQKGPSCHAIRKWWNCLLCKELINSLWACKVIDTVDASPGSLKWDWGRPVQWLDPPCLSQETG